MDIEVINRDLLEAVKKKDLQAIQDIFQLPGLKSTPNWATLLSKRPLEFACEEGHVDIVEFLLKRGNPETYSKDPRRTTLLHRAVQHQGNKNLGIAHVLCDLAAGCYGDKIVKTYINIQSEDGKTALHYAAQKNHLPIAELLLQKGADVNIQDEKGKSALHYAAEKSDLSMVKILVHAGADVTIPDSLFTLAAHIACAECKFDMMEFLFQQNQAGINDKFKIGGAPESTCLHLACKQNSWKAVIYLLEHMEAEVIAHPDSNWKTAWDLACDNPKSLVHFGLGSSRTEHFYRSFPINLEAACALVAKEFESHEDNVQFSWDTYLLNDITLFSFRLNHFRGIYALFGKLLKKGEIRSQDVNRFIRGFQHEQCIVDPEAVGPPILKLREPSCIVAHGNYSKHFTIVMPYFKVLSLKSLAILRGHRNTLGITAGDKPELYQLCPFFSLESLGPPYLPLTLDEYCCPALPKSMLDRRNGDQVLSKAVRNGPEPAEVVTVCQLWSLQFANGLIIAHEQDEKVKDPASEPKPLPWAQDHKTGDIKRYTGIMLTHFIENLDRSSRSKTGFRSPILNTFENFIASCAHDVDEYSRRKDLRKFDIDKERNFLHDIDDIRGELGMIKRVILQQEEVWKTFASNAWPEHWTSGRMVVQNNDERSPEEEDEWHIILRAQSQFDRFRRRIAQLDEDASRIEKSIITKLDLKQKHASLQEAHATALMSAAVLGFTVITIIFTPLSFLTSLFALSIDRFQQSQVDFFIPNRENEADFTNRTRVYTTNYIGKWAATTTLVSTVVSLLVMWLVIEYGMDVPVLRNPAKSLMDSVRRHEKHERR